MVWAKAVRAAGALRMNPPAAIDALFNRIARREALPAGPVVEFDTALSPLAFQVEARLLTKTSFSFLPPAASSNFLPTLRVGVEADTIYGALELRGACCALRLPRVPV